MEEAIEGLAGQASPLETARNRLAKAIFLGCAALILFVITAGQNRLHRDEDVARLEYSLKAVVEYRTRVLQLIDRSPHYLEAQLSSFFSSTCFTPKEVASFPFTSIYSLSIHRDGRSFTVGESLGPDVVNGNVCPDGFISIDVRDRVTLGEIASALQRVVPNEWDSKTKLVTVYGELTTVQSRALFHVLVAYWGEKDTLNRLAARWLQWPSPRNWVLGEALHITAHPKQPRPSRVLDPGDGGGAGEELRLRPRVGGIQPFPQSVNNSLGYERFDADRRRARDAVQAAASPDQLLAALSGQIDALQAEINGRRTNGAWYDTGMGVVSRTYLAWLDWVPLTITLLFGLFILFNERIAEAYKLSSNTFWFPRLGAAHDPLSVTPKSSGEWFAAFLWCIFLTLPSAIALWSLMFRLEVPLPGKVADLRFRGETLGLAELVVSSTYVLCIAFTHWGTRAEDYLKGVRAKQLRLFEVESWRLKLSQASFRFQNLSFLLHLLAMIAAVILLRYHWIDAPWEYLKIDLVIGSLLVLFPVYVCGFMAVITRNTASRIFVLVLAMHATATVVLFSAALQIEPIWVKFDWEK